MDILFVQGNALASIVKKQEEEGPIIAGEDSGNAWISPQRSFS